MNCRSTSHHPICFTLGYLITIQFLFGKKADNCFPYGHLPWVVMWIAASVCCFVNKLMALLRMVICLKTHLVHHMKLKWPSGLKPATNCQNDTPIVRTILNFITKSTQSLNYLINKKLKLLFHSFAVTPGIFPPNLSLIWYKTLWASS